MSDDKSKGLGDTVEKILDNLGVKKIVDKVSDGDCGCDERKEKLNERYPYKEEE